MLTTHHGMGGGGVEVREAGNALKVQSEVPHLVSLGGGRLSTAVTLHPLPEGRMTVGSGQTVDILVQGVGVEPSHCYIDNTGGVVTLLPLAEMISVDKVRVMTPTRLTQGSMVCIGRSNYMRFNHPAEARIMRSVLPNASISMVPLNFYNVSIPGVENVDGIDRKPPMAPRRSPRNSWGDASNSSSCNSGSEESCLTAASGGNRGNLTMPLSPKMFPVGTATVNSPAGAVLGPSHTNNLPSYQQPSQPHGLAYNESPMSVYYNQNCPIQQSPIPNGVVLRNGFPSNGSAFSQTSNNFNSHLSPKSHGETPTNNPFNNTPSNNPTNGFRSQTPTLISTQTFTNKSFGIQLDSRSVTASPALEDTRTIAERRLGCLSSLPGINTSTSPMTGKEANEYRTLTTPSPAFNRNPVSSGRNHVYVPRSVTPSPPKPTHGLNGVDHRRTLSASSQDAGEPLRRISSPTPSYGSNHSLEELAARKEELENKRKQAQSDRLREQETEKNERARLEEILSMCADYERQVQLEKQCKSPGIPQSRIKTNGSLPRDKRLPSPGISASEDETDVFTFDQNSGNASANASTSPLPVTVVTRALNGNASAVGIARSPYENVVLSAGGVAYPQSPRTRIRTIASKETTPVRDTAEVIENRMALAQDYEFVTSLPRRMSNKSPAPQQATIVNNKSPTPQQATVVNHRPSTPQQYANISSIHSPQLNSTANNSTPALSNKISPTPSRKTSGNPKLILPLDINPVDRLSEALEAMKTQNALRNSERRRSMERKRETEKQDRIVQQCVEGSVDEEERQQHIIMLMQSEYAALRKERAKLLAAMSGLKRNVTDIEQQEEELLRELEMERALLDGETAAQGEKLGQERLRQTELRRRLAELDKEVAHFSVMEVQRQTEREARLEAAEEKLHKSEIELGTCEDNAEKLKTLSAQVKAHHELLEQEKKAFEDLEFQYLEQEADCLAGHEELQRELSDVTQRLEARQLRLSELDSQRLEADHAAQLESQGLERQLLSNLRRLEEVRNKLRLIELNLEELSRRGLFSTQDSSPEGSSDNEEYVRPSSAQSPEDIARISRVTKGAPLELGSGSLGRKTLESLQTIERNRQLHLVQQGSQVIENERKRVEELKRRVQDEARAQWAEEQRQREKKCYSLNSVGSDEASSDVPTESASSDDTVDKRNSAQAAAEDKIEQQELDSNAQHNELVMREKELAVERNREETRPLTDGSDYEQQLAVNMRDRDKVARLQHQRPLTRYLPIRSERLDLRHHIETAGHQVDLCPHVALDATSCRGHLHKLGAKFHHWGKRWFVFDRTQRTLTYYGDRTEKKARGGAYFQAIEEVYVDHLNSVKSPNPQLTFVVKTSERTYHLMAPSAEAMRIWVDVVFTGAEGYQGFEHGS